MTWTARVLLAVTLIGIGFLIGTLSQEPEAPIPGFPDQASQTVPLVAEESFGSLETAIQLRWRSGLDLVSPGWVGTITGIRAQPGTVITEGDKPISVDRVDRLAIATEDPLHRRLSPGLRGLDILQFRDLLERLSYLEAGSGGDDRDRYDSGMAGAIGALASDLGRGTGEVIVDPTWFIWLPSPSVPIATVEVATGAPAPGAGAPIFTLEVRLESARLTTGPPEDGYVLEIPGSESVISLDGRDVAEQDLESLLETLALVGIEPGATDPVFAQIHRSVPIQVLQVPASSIGVSAGGEACLWLPGSTEPKSATIVSSSLGVVSVTSSELAAGDLVLLNPDASARTRC